MKTTLLFPDDLLTEVKIEAVRQHRRLKDFVPELVRTGLEAQRRPTGDTALSEGRRRKIADAWLKQWLAVGSRIESKKRRTGSMVESLEADRASRG